MAVPNDQQLLAAAMAHHQAGRLAEADALYRRALEANPKSFDGLHYLGVLAHQIGRHDTAITLIGKAIAINASIPDCHYNIGAALQAAGRLDEAAEHYSKAIALQAGFAEAHYELANVLARQEKLEQAKAHYNNALSQRPDFVDALTNLGHVLMAQGNGREAVECWRKALALRPNDAVARMNYALALKQEGKAEEAVTHLRQVLALKPNYADAHYNLGATLHKLGRIDEAAAAYRGALAYDPGLIKALKALVHLLLDGGRATEALHLAHNAVAADETVETKSLLALCLTSPLAGSDTIDLRALLTRAVSEPWCWPNEVADACIRCLRLNDAIQNGVTRATRLWPRLLTIEDLGGVAGLISIARDPLLRTLLETTTVCDVGFERLLTGLRSILLTAAGSAAGSEVTEPVLDLSCALARQCHINDYVFALSETEIAQVGALRDTLVAALAGQAAVPALTLAAVAAYVPLHSVPGASVLLDRRWPSPVSGLLEQQLRAPLDEQGLRATLPALTAVDDEVSIKVRSQYEEAPYPRWTRPAPVNEPKFAGAVMREKFPHVSFGDFGQGGGVDVLVAGCGTGRQSIEAARRYKDARVLAIDLSLTSLSFALRQTRAIGLNNIHYAQADIMRLPSIGRTFDIIEVSGVLHHLRDPFAGWRGLLTMLRPSGVMLVGLYSRIARRDIASAREFIAERGYGSMARDIRLCRQELLGRPENAPLTLAAEFFNLSECRDLLFHVQERNLTLPDIADFIAGNDLEFLGFDIDAQTRRNYARRFPADDAMTNLAQWHEYEVDNPRTFTGMYHLYVRKRPAVP